MKNILTIIQIISAVALIIVVLLQNGGSGLSGIFGGSGGFYRTKRGMEKTLIYLTIIFSIIFLGLSIAIVLI